MFRISSMHLREIKLLFRNPIRPMLILSLVAFSIYHLCRVKINHQNNTQQPMAAPEWSDLRDLVLHFYDDSDCRMSRETWSSCNASHPVWNWSRHYDDVQKCLCIDETYYTSSSNCVAKFDEALEAYISYVKFPIDESKIGYNALPINTTTKNAINEYCRTDKIHHTDSTPEYSELGGRANSAVRIYKPPMEFPIIPTTGFWHVSFFAKNRLQLPDSAKGLWDPLADEKQGRNNTEITIQAPIIYGSEACINIREIWGNCTASANSNLYPNEKLISDCLCGSSYADNIHECISAMDELVNPNHVPPESFEADSSLPQYAYDIVKLYCADEMALTAPWATTATSRAKMLEYLEQDISYIINILRGSWNYGWFGENGVDCPAGI